MHLVSRSHLPTRLQSMLMHLTVWAGPTFAFFVGLLAGRCERVLTLPDDAGILVVVQRTILRGGDTDTWINATVQNNWQTIRISESWETDQPSFPRTSSLVQCCVRGRRVWINAWKLCVWREIACNLLEPLLTRWHRSRPVDQHLVPASCSPKTKNDASNVAAPIVSNEYTHIYCN